MNDFQNTEAIVILAAPGASSHFTKKLVASFYNSNTHFNVGQMGDAHNFDPEDNLKYTRNDSFKLNMGQFNPIVETDFEPIDKNKPFIIASHTFYFNFQNFYKKYPLTKSIFITITDKDLYRLKVNIYYKNFVPGIEVYNIKHCLITWAHYKKNYNFMKDKEKPSDITQDELKHIITNEINFNKELFFPFKEGTAIGKNDPKIMRLPYRQLLNDPELTLKQISDFLDKPINDNVKQYYSSYLEAQTNFINKHAFWVSDFEK